MDVLVRRGQVVHHLSQAIQRGGWSLDSVPALLRRVIAEDMWRERVVESTGEPARFETWEQFVAAGPPEGLGTTPHTLEQLCQDDKVVLDLLDQVQQRPPHVHAASANGTVRDRNKRGNTSQGALRRLRKDRPDLHARVLAGELSPHGAMVEAGFRRKTITVPMDVHRAAKTIARHFTAEDVALLVKELEATK